VQGMEISLDAFVSWLCSHEFEIVGFPGTWFDAPLARWLSELTGHTYGVDGKLYGRASCDSCRWRLLPQWAEVFSAWVELYAYRPLTGYEALEVLAHVELAFVPIGVNRFS
jgi:hypothetical protein